MQKMGGLSGIAALLPGAGKIQAAMQQANIDESMLKRQQAIISSMTRQEKKDVNLLNASRKRRIAKGSGTEVQEINRLIKQFLQMRDAMKRMKQMGQQNFLKGLAGNFPPMGRG
jgi:signal recognition particle subunit SRP54